jgi:hypothetical protein
VLILRLAGPAKVRFVTGAVLSDDPDPNKQRPIGKATITAVSGPVSGKSTSDPSGFFRLRFRPPVDSGQAIRLTVRHPNFSAFETSTPADDRIHVVRLTPEPPVGGAQPVEPRVTIANVRVRYALKHTDVVEVGSAVRTFEIANRGNVPCSGRPPCSPDGKWKAAVGSLSLNAGSGKQFRNVRVSCIAGPCPFTRIESDGFSRGGSAITVSVRNWSDRVTYLVEAEVAQTVGSDMIRHSYPVIFGRSMNFTLPATGQGPSIEAEVDGAAIVFPLGPNLALSWATCKLEVGSDGTKLYRCELNPSYRFN